jgi:hypothetical protein
VEAEAGTAEARVGYIARLSHNNNNSKINRKKKPEVTPHLAIWHK